MPPLSDRNFWASFYVSYYIAAVSTGYKQLTIGLLIYIKQCGLLEGPVEGPGQLVAIMVEPLTNHNLQNFLKILQV